MRLASFGIVRGRSRRQCIRATRPSPHAGLGRSAFTLIELLIVVAIIALLVSILLPALQKAQLLTRSSMCSSNLHHVGLAVGMYQTSWGIDEPWRFANGTGDNPQETWSEYYPHLPGNPARALVVKGQFLDTPEMFFCPHYDLSYPKNYDPNGIGGADLNTWDKVWGTYTWVYKRIPNDRANGPHDPNDDNVSNPVPWPKNMNNNGHEVGPKSTDLMMVDTPPNNYAAMPWLVALKSSYTHYNGVFVDQHVELIASGSNTFMEWFWGPYRYRWTGASRPSGVYDDYDQYDR